MFRIAIAAAAAGALGALTAGPAASEAHDGPISAAVSDAAGTALGTVTLSPTASGTMLVELQLSGLPAGAVHGMHIHETGDCSAADFTSAGGHLADGREHGFEAEGGPHPGDLPNIRIAADGTVDQVHANGRLTREMVMDGDGSAFIIHSGTDDYASQPSGDAGSRIACGTFGM